MAARKVSVTAIVFGIVNILVALLPPFAGCMGYVYFLREPHENFKHVDVGHPIRAHFDKELPAAKYEAIGSTTCNVFVSLVLVAGAIGLFLNHDWGRWVTIGAAVLMMLTLCIHDIYQLGIVRPSVMEVFRRLLPPGPPGEAEGAQIGFTSVFFLWSCVSPLFMLYLAAMSITLGANMLMRKGADEADDGYKPRRRRDQDDD
jgi:hypothetical protein